MAAKVKLCGAQPPTAARSGKTPGLHTAGSRCPPLLSVVPWQGKRVQRRPLSGQPPLGCGANVPMSFIYTIGGLPEFGHLSLTARRLLLDDLTSAITASDKGVEQGTHQKQHLTWMRWSKWLETVELFDDAYLEAFQPQTRARLLGAFAAAIRSARFSSAAYCQLAAGTVSDTVNHVAAATFVDSGLADPRKHGDGASSRFLQRQYKCYQNLDTDVKQQKAITASILVNVFDHAHTSGEKAAAELAISAFFFAMRSCEYCHMDCESRTKPLRLRNLHFIKENRTLDLSDPRLASADAIAITFEFKKPDVHSETVHQHTTPLVGPLSGAPLGQASAADSVLPRVRPGELGQRRRHKQSAPSHHQQVRGNPAAPSSCLTHWRRRCT